MVFFAGICNFTKKIKHAHGTEISYLPRSNISRKYQLATPSPTKAKIKKRLLKSPQVSDEKPQKQISTTVKAIYVVTIPSFEELSRSKSVHEPAHVDIQAKTELNVRKEKVARRALPFIDDTTTDVKEKKNAEKLLEGEVKVRFTKFCVYLHFQVTFMLKLLVHGKFPTLIEKLNWVSLAVTVHQEPPLSHKYFQDFT